jgi:hypothetical protein
LGFATSTSSTVNNNNFSDLSDASDNGEDLDDNFDEVQLLQEMAIEQFTLTAESIIASHRRIPDEEIPKEVGFLDEYAIDTYLIQEILPMLHPSIILFATGLQYASTISAPNVQQGYMFPLNIDKIHYITVIILVQPLHVYYFDSWGNNSYDDSSQKAIKKTFRFISIDTT